MGLKWICVAVGVLSLLFINSSMGAEVLMESFETTSTENLHDSVTSSSSSTEDKTSSGKSNVIMDSPRDLSSSAPTASEFKNDSE